MEGWNLSVALSISKRPVLEDAEIETILQDGVSIYQGNEKTQFVKGIIILTTHRLFWADAHQNNYMVLHLSQISSVGVSPSGWNGSPKIGIILHSGTDYKLSFKTGGRDSVLHKLRLCLNSKAWEKLKDQPKKKEGFTTAKAGVGGIVRTIDNRTKEAEVTLQQAFTDLSSLAEKAKDMVALAERLTAPSSKEKINEGEESELRSMLISIGISSPVTKESAGSMYHTQLSRQLADWLQKPLQRFGGMITLSDLYCFFNRARGTEMISPEDLQRACVLFEELQLPVRLRRFDSGVLVVQSMNHTDEEIAKQTASIVTRDGPLTAFDLAKTRDIALSLAQEQLLTAERLEMLCRDTTYGGTTFYLNFFQNPSLVNMCTGK